MPVAISTGTARAAGDGLFSRINWPHGFLVLRSSLRIARCTIAMPMMVPSLGFALNWTQLLSASRVMTFWTEREPKSVIGAPK
ncbi:hypothetical protein PIB19_08360 [Sphingomonas sp. 7/4-4]|nr:hypothetical protein [Sphingomonas sp. 7/4-4]WBY09309.1 hypothetical protein PIB19_08360 [Sphingomonas sp. 7/4-4]